MRKSLIIIFSLFLSAAISAQPVTLTFLKDSGTVINRDIYGQFAEHLGRSIYDGFYKDGLIRMDIVDALKKIQVPNLRWPGGCFADQYHWKDGVGPKTKRPRTINTTWGMLTEDNSFGTEEFMELCKMIGCKPYIAGNVGTGSPQEMKEWIEYLNLESGSSLADLRKANGHEQPYGVSLWGVGNESWGCGGNMSPERYADLYLQFEAFCPDYPGAPLKKIAAGANADDYHWTETLMQKIPASEMYGISLHYYTFPNGKWRPRGSATHFTETEYFNTLKQALRMEELIDKHSRIMDKYDPEKNIALLVDEWGVWTDPEPGTPGYAMFQQNSLRDALIAATTLNIFNNHADRVRGANLAQTVNVIHSLILTKGNQLVLTPTYFVFDLYKVHQGAKLVPLQFNSPYYKHGGDSLPALSASASLDSNHRLHISLVNLDPVHSIPVSALLKNKAALQGLKTRSVSGQILTSEALTDINSFDNPGHIRIRTFNDAKLSEGVLSLVLPPKSLVVLEIK